MITLYVIESRTPDGRLDFTDLQPESVFGMGAITGLTDDQMAKKILRLRPGTILSGDSVAAWPTLIHATWSARRKTW
jgi:hypothetical protein